MSLDKGDIRIARYLTDTLPPAMLEKKLREIVHRSREMLARREGARVIEEGDK